MDQDESKKNIESYSIYEEKRKIELKNENPDLENSDIENLICAEWNVLYDESNKSYINKAEAKENKNRDENEIYDDKIGQREEK